MALLLKDGSVFLHIPKTGGNWVTHILKQQDLIEKSVAHKHSDLSRTLSGLQQPHKATIKQFLLRRPVYPSPLKEKPFIFTFVRNPIRWYESWFKYQSQESRQWRLWGNEGDVADWHPNSVLNGLGSENFNEFVRNVQKKSPGYVSELFFTFTTPEVDFVGKQESIRQDLCRALEKTKLDFDADFIMNEKEVGVSKPKKAIIDWDQELLDDVIKNELAALKRFSYLDEIVSRY